VTVSSAATGPTINVIWDDKLRRHCAASLQECLLGGPIERQTVASLLEKYQ